MTSLIFPDVCRRFFLLLGQIFNFQDDTFCRKEYIVNGHIFSNLQGSLSQSQFCSAADIHVHVCYSDSSGWQHTFRILVLKN